MYVTYTTFSKVKTKTLKYVTNTKEAGKGIGTVIT